MTGKEAKPCCYRDRYVAEEFELLTACFTDEHFHAAILANTPPIESPAESDDEHVIV